jgi:protein mago nashi
MVYLRYYVGHRGEFLEIEVMEDGLLRYSNVSNYRGRDHTIRKQVYLDDSVLQELERIVRDAQLMELYDTDWPMPDYKTGKQELEVRQHQQHVHFITNKIGSLVDVEESSDPEALRVFYYFVQDLKCIVFSLIKLHYKIKPI